MIPWLKKYYREALLFLFILLIFIINSSYLSYPDEFVNLLGGNYINQGKIPYKDFFDHHLPFAWYFGSILLRFSFGSFIVFRLFWALVIFSFLTVLAIWIRKNHLSFYRYYLLFFFLYPLVSVYFWLHLYLADSLASLFFSSTFWILFLETQERRTEFNPILITSLLTFFLLFSSLTYFYVALMLYLWQVYLLLASKPTAKKILSYIFLALAPYGMYFFYLLITNSLKGFFFANVTYNTKLYIDIPNYTLGRFFNPLKFGFTLLFNFWNGYLPTLATLRDFNLYLPIGVLSVFSSLILFLVLLNRNFIVGVLFFFILSFSAPRSTLKSFNETDYQIGLFIVLGIISAVLAIFLLQRMKLKNELLNDLRRVSQVLISVYLFFTTIFLLKNAYDKWYLRYTQKMPSIYDIASAAEFIEEVLEKNDHYWIGPYEPHEMFYVKKAKLPGKYISLLPQFKQNEYLKRDFISELDRNPPKIIIFKKNTGIFGTPTYQFGDFFLEWMGDKYTSLENEKTITVLKSPSSFKIDIDLYLSNSYRADLLKKLKLLEYIR